MTEAAKHYDVGDLVRASATFRGLDGVAADPTAVVGKYRDPSGNISTASVTQDSVGGYHFDIDVDEAGTWYYRFAGTGAIQAAGEKSFVADTSHF